MTERYEPWLQAPLGWAALVLVLAASLHNGATPPAAWILMCLAALLLFALQVAVDFGSHLPKAARRAWIVALPYFAVVLWLQVQTLPGLPEHLAHPAWARAPDGAVPTISIDPVSGRPVVMRLTCYALLFWVFLRSFAPAGRARTMISAFALFSTFLALYGFFARTSGHNVLLGLDDTGFPLRATFVNQNNYATFAIFGVLANITAFYNLALKVAGPEGTGAVRSFRERLFATGWVYAFGVISGLAAIAMTGSRAGAVAGVIGLVVLVGGLARRHVRSGQLARTALAVGFAFIVMMAASGTFERLAGSSEDIRFRIYPQVIEGAFDRPVLGHGGGGFTKAFHAYIEVGGAEIEWQYAHNSYLENAFEFGLPAAAGFFVALLLIGGHLLHAVLTSRRDQGVPAFSLACFAAAAFHATWDGSLQIPAIAAAFAAITAVGWAQSFPEQNGGKSGSDRGAS